MTENLMRRDPVRVLGEHKGSNTEEFKKQWTPSDTLETVNIHLTVHSYLPIGKLWMFIRIPTGNSFHSLSPCYGTVSCFSVCEDKFRDKCSVWLSQIFSVSFLDAAERAEYRQSVYIWGTHFENEGCVCRWKSAVRQRLHWRKTAACKGKPEVWCFPLPHPVVPTNIKRDEDSSDPQDPSRHSCPHH